MSGLKYVNVELKVSRDDGVLSMVSALKYCVINNQSANIIPRCLIMGHFQSLNLVINVYQVFP